MDYSALRVAREEEVLIFFEFHYDDLGNFLHPFSKSRGYIFQESPLI
jgi:hypothetical protein